MELNSTGRWLSRSRSACLRATCLAQGHIGNNTRGWPKCSVFWIRVTWDLQTLNGSPRPLTTQPHLLVSGNASHTLLFCIEIFKIIISCSYVLKYINCAFVSESLCRFERSRKQSWGHVCVDNVLMPGYCFFQKSFSQPCSPQTQCTMSKTAVEIMDSFELAPAFSPSHEYVATFFQLSQSRLFPFKFKLTSFKYKCQFWYFHY